MLYKLLVLYSYCCYAIELLLLYSCVQGGQFDILVPKIICFSNVEAILGMRQALPYQTNTCIRNDEQDMRPGDHTLHTTHTTLHSTHTSLHSTHSSHISETRPHVCWRMLTYGELLVQEMGAAGDESDVPTARDGLSSVCVRVCWCVCACLWLWLWR